MTSSRTNKGKIPSTPSHSEILNVLLAFDAGILTSAQAIAKTGLSRSTFFRHIKTWRETGKLPTNHGNRNRSPVNKLDPALEKRIKELAETKFAEMQPTMLSHCLKKYEGISISVETARRILHELHPEQSARERRSAAHALRRRRTTCGELVQIDGSPHHWFGEERPPACLIAFIDDATGKIMAADFFETESVEGYFSLLIRYISRHGIPVALYSDRHSIFKVVGERHEESTAETQYQRACKSLGIQPIYAYSPQAKGRVERLFQTLQGRWPLEFRVRGIISIDEANQHIEEFVEDFNQEFGIPPQNDTDSHVRITADGMEEVIRQCGIWEERLISKNLTVSFKSKIIQIKAPPSLRYALIGTSAYIVQRLDGKVELLWKDAQENKDPELPVRYRTLEFVTSDRSVLPSITEPLAVETAKTIDAAMDRVMKRLAAEPNRFAALQSAEARRAMARKQRKEKQLEEAKKVEARVAAAKAKLHKK